MDNSLVVFILWLPFVFLFAIYGTIYSIRGYKKGLYRSLVSVGATVVSGIISALLAKFFAVGIADNAYNAMLAETVDDTNAIYTELIELFAKGILQGFVALFMFSAILFFLTIILKVIAGVIVKDKFEPENKIMRWSGLGVRFVEAIIFSLLLLLPIYGTMATYLPVAEEIIGLVDTPAEQGGEVSATEIIGQINNHPLLKAAKTKPMQVIYNGIAESKVENTNLNLPKIVSSVSGIFEQLKGIENLPENEQKAAVQSLIKYIDKNLVGQEWFYDIYLLAKDELVKMYNSSTGDLSGEEKKIADEFIKTLDISEKDFQSCIKESLNFAEYLLESDIIEKIKNEDANALYSDECLYNFGKWLNCNESMLSVKKMIVMSFLGKFMDSEDNLMNVLSKVNLKIHTNKEEQKKEAGAILVMLKGDNKLVIAEALVRHPDFGYDFVKDYIITKDFADLVYFDSSDENSNIVLKFLNENPNIVSELLGVLKEYVNKPLVDESFADYAENKIREATAHLGLENSSFGGEVSFSPNGSFTVNDGEVNYYYSDGVSGGNGGIFSAVMG
jgi:hypothetical protein